MISSPILNIFIRFGNIRHQISISTEFGPNFAFFRPLKNFREDPLKFWTEIIKRNAAPSTAQNFTAIGPRSSEITREKN